MIPLSILEEPNSNAYCWSITHQSFRKKRTYSLFVIIQVDIQRQLHYRKLKQVSEGDIYPTPRIDELIDKVWGVTYISTSDLVKGYWQVPVSEKDRVKNCIFIPSGLYQFNTMPFRLQGAPATFQRLMDQVIRGLDFAACYIDDLIIFSKTWQEHVSTFKQFLNEWGKQIWQQKLRSVSLEQECVSIWTTLSGVGLWNQKQA